MKKNSRTMAEGYTSKTQNELSATLVWIPKCLLSSSSQSGSGLQSTYV